MLVQLCSEARARTDCHKLRISTGQVTVRQAPRQQQPQTQQPQTKPKPKPNSRRHLPSKPKRVRIEPKPKLCCCSLPKDRRISPTVAECGRSSALFFPLLRHDAHVVQSRSTWLDFYANTLRRGPIRKAANTPRETNLRTYRKHTENIPQNIKRRLQFSINNSQLVQLPRDLYIFSTFVHFYFGRVN